CGNHACAQTLQLRRVWRRHGLANSSVQPKATQRVLQVRPWAESYPSCYLAVLDCYHLGIEGWRDAVEKSGVNLTDPAFWEASAAITNTNHPALIWFYLVRVNLTDGVLPAGAQSYDFPAMLYGIEFCYTNLRELPDDLDTKWMIGSSIYIEYSNLTNVPLLLTRLDPYYLALAGNPIVELPVEIFEVPGMYHLGLGNMSVTELPSNVTSLSPLLSFIHLTNTDISFFWSWIDTLVKKSLGMEAPLKMGGSKYCADREKIIQGEAHAFSVGRTVNYSPMLMDSSQVNRDVICNSVNCDMLFSRAFYHDGFILNVP
ncbi:hypothetical protein JG687_00002916, partial [Phytophthora cactorum]